MPLKTFTEGSWNKLKEALRSIASRLTKSEEKIESISKSFVPIYGNPVLKFGIGTNYVNIYVYSDQTQTSGYLLRFTKPDSSVSKRIEVSIIRDSVENVAYYVNGTSV